MSENKKTVYPKSEDNRRKETAGDPAYVSWASAKDRENAFSVYGDALETSAHSVVSRQQRSVAANRDFRNLTTTSSGRPGLNYGDFDWFRPGQAAPVKPKDVISFARFAYRSIGLIHNAIDLMGDFACQGIRLVHPNSKIENFHNDWFKQVEGKRVSERLGHLLFREANTPIRHYTARINKKKRLNMQKAIGSADIRSDLNDPIFKKNEIPWRYTFIDPLLIEPVGGALANLSTKKLLRLKIPQNLRNDIKNLQNSIDPEIRKVLNEIAPDIIAAVNSGKDLLLPPEKTNIYYYKKDDWQTWADPMTYSAFEPLNLYRRLQLTDKAALDGAMNKIRVWKIGSLDHKLAPTPTASSTLADMLGANVGGGTIDIVWGPDIELLETSSDIQSYLGEEKYRPTLMAIYASLGIPPTLTGTFGASGTTNNFIALKTLVERLNYVRNIILDFWNEQLAIVQKAMGFRVPATVEFDIMYLEDPAAMTTLLLNMADRNIISDEFVQRHIKAKPMIENRRVQKENNSKNTRGVEKVSPYHQVDQDHALEKIALQTGVASPSEVGLELDEKKSGEKSLMDLKESQLKMAKVAPPNSKGPGTPGRPKSSKDKTARKPKTFQPKNKASIELWAKQAQVKISDIINPIILHSINKTSLRNLNSEEFLELEQIKFEILCNLDIGNDVNEVSIAEAAKKPLKSIHAEFDMWIEDAKEHMGKLNIEQVRDMRASYYVYHNCGNNENE